jgi:hypothetical protein
VFAEFGSANSDDDGVRVCHSKESCRPYPDFLLPSIESLLKLMRLSVKPVESGGLGFLWHLMSDEHMEL